MKYPINYPLWLMAFALAIASCSNEETIGYDYQNVISELKVSQEQVNFGCRGGVVTLYAQSVSAVSISSDAAWLTCQAGEQSPVLHSTPITLTASDCTGETASRSASVTITAGGQSQQVQVYQSPDAVILSVEPASVAGEGGYVTVRYAYEQGPASFDIPEEAQSWITAVEPTRVMTQDTQSFYVASHVGEQRSALITLTATSADGYTRISESFTITQDARETSIDPEATAMRVAALMYPGWNLGNTMEGTSGSAGLGDETGWQSTKTTQQIIDFVASQGFRSVRIPCSWYRHMDANHQIDASWMARVQEVVDYCVNDGLYVLLNDHYDTDWIETHMDTYDTERAAIMTTLWTQVAQNFQAYDEHLIFAGLNEPNADNQSKTDNLVRYEQDFIDAVRATGGNNLYRTLVVQGPSTDIDNTQRYYKTLPTDQVKDRMMVEVHFYSPWTFCGLEADADWGNAAWFYGAANHVSGSTHNTSSSNEESYVASQMQKLQTQFTSQGIPVIIGEYGCQWRELSDHQAEHDASVRLFHETVVRESIDHGCVPVVWDINALNRNGERGIMTIIDRAGCSVWCQPAMEGITAGYAAAHWPY